MDMQKIHTNENLADVMIKPVSIDKFTWIRSYYGLYENKQRDGVKI